MSPRVARFQWNNANIKHIAAHFISRDEVEQAFLDPFAYTEGGVRRMGELRWQMLGSTADRRVITVVFVIREGMIRPVTAYTAKGRLLARYLAGRMQ